MFPEDSKPFCQPGGKPSLRMLLVLPLLVPRGHGLGPYVSWTPWRQPGAGGRDRMEAGPPPAPTPPAGEGPSHLLVALSIPVPGALIGAPSLPGLRPGTRALTSRSLSVFICKVGITTDWPYSAAVADELTVGNSQAASALPSLFPKLSPPLALQTLSPPSIASYGPPSLMPPENNQTSTVRRQGLKSRVEECASVLGLPQPTTSTETGSPRVSEATV